MNKSKFYLNLAFILITLFACYAEYLYLYFRMPHPGDAAIFTYRCQSPFSFNEEKAYTDLRNTAITRESPIYKYEPERAAPIQGKMEAFVKEIAKVRNQGITGRRALVRYVKKEFGVEISLETAARLIKYPDLKNILAGILTIQESVAQGKIVEDPGPFKGKATIQVISPDPIGLETFPAGGITTLEKARLSLREKVQQIFWQIDPAILQPLLQITLATLQPNLRFDPEANSKRIAEILQQYPARVISYKPGDVLVPFRKVLDQKDVLLLAAGQEAEKNEFYGRLPWVLFVICFSVLLYNLLLPQLFSPCWRMEPPYQLFLIVLTLTILVSKACLLFTPYPVYLIPFVILPLLLVLLLQERISITFTTVLGAILISIFSSRNLEIFLFFTFSGLVAILASFRIRKRFHILIPSLLVGATNAAAVFLLLAGSPSLETATLKAGSTLQLLSIMGWAFVGGLVSGPLVLLFLPLLETSWHYASAFKLNKFSDLQHPLMLELLTKAPGTYQHAMTAAHLACALGEAIGANSLLLRVAAYYHDIGKTLNPEFFVENLFGKKSPHDTLTASESTKIIMDHVKNGRKIALEAGLPEVAADFIPQHHGTLLVEYFYDKALKENPQGEVNPDDFRYPGPKPQSVEAAILMIVDAAEATSRTLEEPTRENLEAMIRHIIVNRMTDGQLDECNLSTREIAKIITVLVHALEASFHTRVEYPWQQKEKSVNRNDNQKEPEPPAKKAGKSGTSLGGQSRVH